MLKSRGNFYMGGHRVFRDAVAAGRSGPPGHIVVNQMYVEFMVPTDEPERVPLVMIHGTSTCGKTYDTTPDGRMGWFEHVVRRGHPAYVVDQVGRGRSGFDPSTFNDVRAGRKSLDMLPNISRFNDEFAWASFRIGPAWGVPFEDTRFPHRAAFALGQQNIPDLNAALPEPNPTWQALADLAAGLGGAVLLGHSQSGAFPIDAALKNPHSVRGMVIVEPGSQGCKAQALTVRDMATLAAIPTLVVFGDHLDADTLQPSSPRLWRRSFDDSQRFLERLQAAGGNGTMLHLPGLGIFGNSHMLMQDDNNRDIADLILNWVHQNVIPHPTPSPSP